MSNRANSSAKNKRAGPAANIQENLTNNLSSNNNQGFDGKKEPKLLSITQAFILINGKIRNLENQVESMTKIIEHGNSSSSVTSNAAVKQYDEISDTSEFRPSENIDEDFYNYEEKNNNVNNMNTMNPLSQMSQMNNMNNMSEKTKNELLTKYQELHEETNSVKTKCVEIENKTENISNKLTSIESLVDNVKSLSGNIPDFMKSVNERFTEYDSHKNEDKESIQNTMRKVEDYLNKYNTQLEDITTRLTGMQDYALSLHNTFIKRFDEHVDENYEKVTNKLKTVEKKKESKKKSISNEEVFDLNKNQEKEIENCLDTSENEDNELENHEDELEDNSELTSVDL